MRDHFISVLSFSCGALTLSYIALVGFTIFFASWQTTATQSLRSTEGQLGTLEANYYTAMDHASSLNPTQLGYVTPKEVQFVPAAQDASVGLTFAGN
jgi:hypothetical protein